MERPASLSSSRGFRVRTVRMPEDFEGVRVIVGWEGTADSGLRVF